MNWLGLEPRVALAAVAGCIVGALIYGVTVGQGTPAPWVVGAGVGLGALLAARTRSWLRGLVIATLAIWAAALAQAAYAPERPEVLSELGRFHETLVGLSGWSHALGAALACALGGWSLREGSRPGDRGTPGRQSRSS